MKIGIDCRLWTETGVGRYIRNLVSNLAEIDRENEYVLFVQSKDADQIKKSVVSGQWSVVTTDIPWHGIAEQVDFPKVLNAQHLDLMHFPYFSVPFFYYKPFVVTVHDLIINKTNTGKASTLPYPVYLAKRLGYHAVLSNAVYRSKKIIVPSKAVREDLLKTYLNLSPEKIAVTEEGGFDRKFVVRSSQFAVRGKYLLRVGNFYPHKNVEGLLKAFSLFVKEPGNKSVKLVLVGKEDYFYEKITKEIHQMNIKSNVDFVSNPDDSELFSLYKNATATIVPSFMEGFSLTAIEAMSAGSPVIASDIPVHREVCGEAAIYCNPEDIKDIKQKISFAVSLVESSRKELINQGKKQSEKFSWEKMAMDTLKIYKDAQA